MNKLEIEYVDIDTIYPSENNAKLHPPEQIEQIKLSIERNEFNDPIAVKDNKIIEGHGRYLACKELGIKEVPIIRLDYLTEEQAREYMLVHNKLTMNSDFDLEKLQAELDEIDFDMSEYGFESPTGEEEKEIVEVDIPDIPEEPKTKPGEIYQLGKHRLMVGDSTEWINVEKLSGGAFADLLFTDPPYNVNISNSEGMTIENDNMNSEAFHEFLSKAFENAAAVLKPGAAFYIWYASREHINFETALQENGLQVHEQLIWVKNSFTFGRQDYKWQHEPCLYGWKNDGSHYFKEEFNHATIIEDRLDFDKMKKEDLKKLLEEIFTDNVAKTIIRENKPLKNDLHPTMKPVRMCAALIRNSTQEGETVLDLFGGSGSTLMACEQLNRICNIMEYDPKYADVIIKRWEDFTGEKAVLIND